MRVFRRLMVVSVLVLMALRLDARADTPSTQPIDPPDAVGRVGIISGTVLFRTDAAQSAAPAQLNYPLSLGNVVETVQRAHATIDIAAGRFYLDGRTRLRIGALTDGASLVALDQGALVLHVLPGGNGQVFAIETAKGNLRIDQPGYYEVEAGEGDQPTTASAMEGGAQFQATDRTEYVLHPGERIAFADGSASPQRGPVVEDDLIRRVASEVEEIGENRTVAPEHVSSQITGFQDLARYGMWELTGSYGAVWKPQVGADWTPYSRGRWVDIAPWGKTWIDEAPWGFAPFHYGRWITVNERWAWLPGDLAAAPVYAPALVSFFDTPADKNAARRWIPLGPEEPYLPPYPVSVVYFRAINRPSLPAVVNITNITNIVQITNVVKIVKRRPVLIFNRLANRPGAPAPKANIIGMQGGSAMVVTQSSQVLTGPAMRPILPDAPSQQGTVVVVNPSPSVSPSTTWNEPGFLVQPFQRQQPIVVIRNNPPPVASGGGGGATPPPVVVKRNMPAATNPTLGTGVGLGTQATTMPRPTVTFGASPGANSVTFP